MRAPGAAVTLPPPDSNAAKEALTHFASAFLFLLLGVAGLLWNSPRLSQGLYSDARVLGSLHWLTLGWLSVSIFGALHVFTGVALGTQGLARGLVPWIRRLWVGGSALFPAGLTFGLPPLIVTGVSFVGLALVLFTAHFVPALARSQRGELTRGYLAVALLSLWGTWLLGAQAALVRSGNPLGTLPMGYFHAHILLAVFGWVGATVVGVGSHLIPMFALSRDPAVWPVKLALPLWASLPVLGAIGAFYPRPVLTIAWIVAAVGSVLWIAQVVIYHRARLRRERDSGLGLALGATALLGIAWAVGVLARAPVAFVGMLVIGWLTLFTLGIYHRVIPFLVWFARFARGAGKGRVPKVKELLDEKVGLATMVIALSGAVAWNAALLLGWSSLAYAGSSLLLASCLLALSQLRSLFGDAKQRIVP